MASLRSLFTAYRESLATSLEQDPSPAGVVLETRHFLDTLRLRYQEEAELSPAQSRLLPYLMDALKAGMNSLASANRTQLWQRETGGVSAAAPPPSRHRPRSWWRRWWRPDPTPSGLLGRWKQRWLDWLWRVLQIALTAALALLMLWENELLALLLALLLLAAQIQAWHNRAPARPGAPAPLQAAAAPRLETAARVEVDLNAFLNALGDALFTADKLLDEAAALGQGQAQGSGANLEDHPALLELLQDLLEARNSEDSVYALKKTRAVPALLEQYNISIEHYTGDNAQYFEFLPSLDPADTDYKTITPALLKDSRVLRRGHVTEPDL